MKTLGRAGGARALGGCPRPGEDTAADISGSGPAYAELEAEGKPAGGPG